MDKFQPTERGKYIEKIFKNNWETVTLTNFKMPELYKFNSALILAFNWS